MKINKKCLIIRHDHSVGGQLQDRMFWCGMIENDIGMVWDYGLKHQLIEQAIDCGMDYKVLRMHRNGEISVMENSLGLKKGTKSKN